MAKLLIDSREAVVTMDASRTEIPGGSILIEDGRSRRSGGAIHPAAKAPNG